MNSGTADAKAREDDMREETPRSAFATELPVPIGWVVFFECVCECGEEQCTVYQCERLAEGVRGEVCEERIHREAPRGRGLWVLEHMLIERGRTKLLTFDDYQDGTVSVRPSFFRA